MTKLACLHCDLLVSHTNIQRGQSAVCPRCREVIYLDQQAFNTSLSLLLTALLFYFPAILLPFVQMEIGGRTHEISLLSSISTIAKGNSILLAGTVLMLVLVFPLIKFWGLLSIMLPISHGRLPFFGVGMTRFILRSAPWSMTDVYLIGVMVTMVKIAGMATVTFSLGFFCFVALIIINAALSVKLPRKRIWQSIALIKMAHNQHPINDSASDSAEAPAKS